jgi:hypothetical protein
MQHFHFSLHEQRPFQECRSGQAPQCRHERVKQSVEIISGTSATIENIWAGNNGRKSILPCFAPALIARRSLSSTLVVPTIRSYSILIWRRNDSAGCSPLGWKVFSGTTSAGRTGGKYPGRPGKHEDVPGRLCRGRHLKNRRHEF